MRAFIAIPLPGKLKDYIAKLKADIGYSQAKIRWVKKEQMHLTLKFMAVLREEELPDLLEKLRQIKQEPYNAALSSAGFFPPKGILRVIWVCINDNGKTYRLHEQIDKVLEEFEFSPEPNFQPHITIGRVKFTKDRDTLANIISSLKIKEYEFLVDKFELIKSTLGPEGPVYELIESFPFSEK